LAASPDRTIWAYAAADRYVRVTKDEDSAPQPAARRALTIDEHEAIRHEAAARPSFDEAALIHEWVKERLGRT
jgi:hypothetical protein